MYEDVIGDIKNIIEEIGNFYNLKLTNTINELPKVRFSGEGSKDIQFDRPQFYCHPILMKVPLFQKLRNLKERFG